MFFNNSTSASNTFSDDTEYGKKEPTLFSLSQNSSSFNSDNFGGSTSGNAGSSRSSVNGSGVSRKSKQVLDAPCRPVTVSLLYQAMKRYDESLHELLEDSGPVSLVGWPVNISQFLSPNPGECQFKFSDGTGVITVRVMVYSENEDWLIQRLKNLLNIPKNSTEVSVKKNFCYLRIVGTPSPEDSSDHVTIRCIHARQAEKEEIAFYHTLDVMAMCLHTFPTISLDSETTPHAHKENRNVVTSGEPSLSQSNSLMSSLESVQLPDAFSLCRDNSCQYTILQYIMKYRDKSRGVLMNKMKNDLSSCFDSERIIRNLDELMDMAFCMVTYEGYVDVVIDEDKLE